MSLRPLGGDSRQRRQATERIVAHARSRFGILAGGSLLAMVWAAAPRPAPFDSTSISDLLASEIGGDVAADEYVWERSRGALLDLYPGRGVVFLGRADASTPRDVFRGHVSVLPSGRPLAVRDVRALTATSQGDESDLEVAQGRAVHSTRFLGVVQSITSWSLSNEGPAYRIAVPRPTRTIAFELNGDDLIVAPDSGSGSVVDLRSGTTLTGEWLEVATAAPPGVAPPSPSARVIEGKRATEPPTMPPPQFAPAVGLEPDREPAISIREGAGVTALVADGRQLAFELRLGTDLPVSATGYIPAIPVSSEAQVVLALEVVNGRAPDIAGAFDEGGWIAPFRSGAATLATKDGTLTIAPWSLGSWDRPDPSIAVQWAGDAARPGWTAFCVTTSGHLAIAWTSDIAIDPQGSLPDSCGQTFATQGGIVEARWGASIEVPVSGRTQLVATRRPTAPSVSLPKETPWRPATSGLPPPAFLPAVYTAMVPALGTDVTLLHIDASRFDWTMVAGTDERSHRRGGRFPVALVEPEKVRARIALGLGVAKRRGPRGLRIGGSTGHAFSGKGAVLVAGLGTLQAVAGRDIEVEEKTEDATELVFTVNGGQLVEPARDRGPLQLRADLCFLPDGNAVVAYSEFDSHEANATVLTQLGCDRAVALDRGAEHPSFVSVGDASRGPFETTALIGLARPLRGQVEGDWRTHSDEQGTSDAVP